MVKKKEKTSEFSFTLLVGDKTYTAEGDTFKETFNSLKPDKITGKIWFTAKRGNNKCQFAFNYLKWKLLFVKPVHMDMFEKKVMMFLK